ncbi:transcription factor bHLH68-like isoform X2 [Momordica charantia]|uniref:Transcription factor bHLH68-like isoform X2 n=1 Tax=Momordica charantia TaxID=3673 RepID=A0A6J1DJE0_MOMCH|nr:transcription factor bHLH68-like isoform X2 [Momordica charantia]
MTKVWIESNRKKKEFLWQMMGGNPSNWWSMLPPNSLSAPQFVLGSSPLPLSSMADHHNILHNPEPNSQSWSQLLVGGLQEAGDHEERLVLNSNNFEAKKFETLEGRILIPFPRFGVGSGGDVLKQESCCESRSKNLSFLWNNNEESSSSSPAAAASSSSNSNSVNSCLTSNAILDFSFHKVDSKNQIPDHNYSSECASTAATGGGVCKKARVQPTSGQPPMKVRKEKVGDRITALHQLVSPFGKTDTASVLSEAIGYVRFLQSQIEALISPYLGNSSKPTKKEQFRTLNDGRNLREVEGERGRSCVFPEDPGQLLNDNSLKRKLPPHQENEGGKDLRSRGLCLVPVSCTQLVQSDINGADYWAQAYNGSF